MIFLNLLIFFYKLLGHGSYWIKATEFKSLALKFHSQHSPCSSCSQILPAQLRGHAIFLLDSQVLPVLPSPRSISTFCWCQQAIFDYAHSLKACLCVLSNMGIKMVITCFSTNFIICKSPHTLLAFEREVLVHHQNKDWLVCVHMRE